jgi:hypothetical protein
MHRICHSDVGIVVTLLENFEVIEHVVPLFPYLKVSCTLKANFDRCLHTRNNFELNNILTRRLTPELLETFR